MRAAAVKITPAVAQGVEGEEERDSEESSEDAHEQELGVSLGEAGAHDVTSFQLCGTA